MDTFGPYRLLRLLGAGHTGEVFEAVHQRGGAHVALKRLHARLVQNREASARFRREFRAAARVRHPAIIRVMDSGRVRGIPFFTMEQLAASTLRASTGKGPARGQELSRMLGLLSQVAEGLHALHMAGVIHREIKPDNVLLRGQEQAVLTNLGLARMLDDAAAADQSAEQGTVRYLAPELATGGAANAETDAYALGVMAYELLCGEPPFDGPEPAVLIKHVEHTPTDVRRHNPQIPDAVAALLAQLLQKNADDRPTVAKAAAVLGRPMPPPVREPSMVPPLQRTFVGRADEMTRLMDRVATLADPGPRVAVISAPPGLGKSRFLSEVELRALRSGCAVAAGRHDGVISAPYLPWRAPLEKLCRKLRMPAPDFDGVRSGRGREHRAQLWRQVAGVLERTTELGRLVICLDDMDGADELSLGLLARCAADEVSHLRFMVAITASTTDRLGPLLDAPATVMHLPLAPLTHQQSLELARAAAPDLTADDVFSSENSGGVPARVVEAALAAVEARGRALPPPIPLDAEVTAAAEATLGRVEPPTGPFEPPPTDPASPPPLPRTAAFPPDPPPLPRRAPPPLPLQGPSITLLNAELGPHQWLVSALAVLRTRAPMALVLRLLDVAENGRTGRMLDEALETLLQRQHLQQAGGLLAFTTEGRRIDAYASIDLGLKEKLHARAAKAIRETAPWSPATAEVLAFHAQRGGAPLAAAEHLLAAAEAALNVWAVEKAQGLVARAIDVLAQRATQTAPDVWTGALSVAPELAVRLALVQLGLLRGQGAAEPYLHAAMDAVRLAANVEPGLQADTHAHLAGARLQAGQHAAAADAAQTMAQLADHAKDAVRSAEAALLQLAVARTRGLPVSRSHLAEALTHARRSGDARIAVRALLETARVHLDAGQARRAAATAQHALKRADPRMMPREALAARRTHALALLDTGHTARATDMLVACVSDAELEDQLHELSEGLLALGRVHLGSLQLSLADTAAMRAARLGRELGNRTLGQTAVCLRALAAGLVAVRDATLHTYLEVDVPMYAGELGPASTHDATAGLAHVAIRVVRALGNLRASHEDEVTLASDLEEAAGASPRLGFEARAWGLVCMHAWRAAGKGAATQPFATVYQDLQDTAPSTALDALMSRRA